LRIAFDHLGLRKPYETAVRIACGFGLTELSNYMLYNFHETPADLYERMALNVELNESLGIRIWSFPMRYQPTDLPNRSHIGEKWTRYQLRSMQLILQATHGVVSGAPVFFRRAFGPTVADFEALLLRPYHFIFNRDWFEGGPGRGEFDDFQASFSTLTPNQRRELVDLLSSCEPRDFKKLPGLTRDASLRNLFSHYVPLSKETEGRIWKLQKKTRPDISLQVPDDERVEDAGLTEEPSFDGTAVMEGIPA
jgi:hypothetical protein